MALHALAAPLRRRHNEDEYSYVIRGTLGALPGGEVVIARAGQWVLKPRERWHAFWNAGDTHRSRRPGSGSEAAILLEPQQAAALEGSDRPRRPLKRQLRVGRNISGGKHRGQCVARRHSAGFDIRRR